MRAGRDVFSAIALSLAEGIDQMPVRQAMTPENSRISAEYLSVLDKLERARTEEKTPDEIASLQVAEKEAWAKVTELMPNAMCR